jgi:pimeloyl-ACP methyl ester carboxylesterase
MYAKFMSKFMDALFIPEAVLAGNSLGGGVAWRTAVLYPNRVSKLVLVDAVGYPGEPKSMPLAFRLAQFTWLSPVLTKLLPRPLIAQSVRNVYGDPSKVTEALIDRYYELALRTGNRQALFDRLSFYLSAVGSDKSFSHQIKDIRQPTLILWGELDQLIPQEHGHSFHRDIANSELVMMEGVGHVPMEEDPEGSVVHVLRFLASQ